MKKIITAAACAVLAGAVLQAQNVTDALRYSKNEYYGTARTMAMGNAFTALGGDIGSIGINPAGSAVNNYSQFAVTPGLNIQSSPADYSAYGVVGDGNPYTTTGNTQVRFVVPSIGMTLNIPTERKRGLMGVTLGITANTSGYYNDNMTAGGTNSLTSYAGYLSALASGAFSASDALTTDQIGSSSYWNMDPFYWPQMVGYRSGMVNESGSGDYLGVTEGTSGSGTYYLRGALDQSYSRSARGNKTDLVFNLGFNINNVFFFGANLGIVDMDYKFDSYLREAAENSDMFPVTIGSSTDYFRNFRFHQAYSATGVGIYGKFGIIAVPVQGLRLGAAIQTPTSTALTEHLWYGSETNFGTNSFSEEISPSDEYVYDYMLTSPMRYNFGVAYTMPGLGLISADYEACDYSAMRFREKGGDEGSFESSNQGIRDYAGISHMLRVGAEFLLDRNYAVRVGYNLSTTPERYIDDSGNKKAPSANTNAVSLGGGYSAGTFFCDLALRYTMYPKEYLYPYSSYDSNMSPEIVVRPELWNIALTLGWKF